MSAKPYSDEEIRAARSHLASLANSDKRSGDIIAVARDVERRWLATVDALQARLAAAERERAKAVGLLLCYRILDNHGLDADKCGGLPDLPFDAMRAAGLPRAGHLGDCYDIVRRAVDDFRVRIASRPEGEVRS